ncbi:hypothetical protein HU200_046767 [Digitaria exilis]|uniref:DUF1618 domain-containing protein n=1 Tax=Digitaria exilis TaxID=1010633 RepID=A0A835AW03_9POAL|nr:hypothetical protein HU200_046767 [Digitaria exilis]
MSDPAFPNWAILEPFVFRRDDSSSFPDKTKAPIRASATTSWGASFRIAFVFADPPRVSRLYAQLPGFPDPKKQTPLAILGTHRHLALLRVGMQTPARDIIQDFFVYSAHDPSELRLLPPCTAPHTDDSLRPIPLEEEEEEEGAPAQRRLLGVTSMGLVSRGEGEQDFAVVELKLSNLTRTEVCADICLFRSSPDLLPSARVLPGGEIGGQWDSMRVPIVRSSDPDDTWQLCLWQTDAVVPVGRWLCWIDYRRGILFCDVFGRGPTPTVSFLRFPLDEFPSTHNRSNACSWVYRVVTPIDGGQALKFVDVARNDHVVYGALQKFGAFTVTCHTLQLGSVAVLNKSTLSSLVWRKDSTTTSDELWSANPPERLPRGILMFPLVNIDRPQVVHFLFSDFKHVLKKICVVAIDMSTNNVESCYKYVNGKEDTGTVDADLTKERSTCPRPFLPCEFSKYLNMSR